MPSMFLEHNRGHFFISDSFRRYGLMRNEVQLRSEPAKTIRKIGIFGIVKSILKGVTILKTFTLVDEQIDIVIGSLMQMSCSIRTNLRKPFAKKDDLEPLAVQCENLVNEILVNQAYAEV